MKVPHNCTPRRNFWESSPFESVVAIDVPIVAALLDCRIEYPHNSLITWATAQNNILSEARNRAAFTLLTVVKQP